MTPRLAFGIRRRDGIRRPQSSRLIHADDAATRSSSKDTDSDTYTYVLTCSLLHRCWVNWFTGKKVTSDIFGQNDFLVPFDSTRQSALTGVDQVIAAIIGRTWHAKNCSVLKRDMNSVCLVVMLKVLMSNTHTRRRRDETVASVVWTHPSAVVTQFTISCADNW